jgi:hypothetical protein
MSGAEQAYLILAIGAFSFFAVTMLYVDATGHRK